MKIESLKEWLKVENREHVIVLRLGDETDAECANYEFMLEPSGAEQLIAELRAAVCAQRQEFYPPQDGDDLEWDVETQQWVPSILVVQE